MKMLHSFPSRAKHRTVRVLICANLVFIVALGLSGVMCGPAARAQAQQTPEQISGVFDQDLVDVKPSAYDALMNAVKKAHRACYPPRATFTIVSDPQDPDFLKSLNNARASALTSFLSSKGLDPSQFKVLPGEPAKLESVQVNYDKFKPDNDTDAPKLRGTSIPPKDTKVKPGDKIKVTITASERYEDGHKSWPTGVQNIQLIADDGLVDSKDYGRPPQPCERRTFEATYTVPKNPPPIVHLRAIAEDGVGNQDSEVGEFPTVDWKGTWQLSYQKDLVGKPVFPWEYMHLKDTFRARFVLSVEPDGTVRGAVEDAVVTYKWDDYGCFSSSGSGSTRTCVGRCKGDGELPVTPVHLTVTGHLNGQLLHLKLVPAADERPILVIAHTCVGEAGTRKYNNTVNWFCGDLRGACAASGHFLEVDLPFVDGASHKIERSETGGGVQGVVQLQRIKQ